jgi:hypothetical protein
MVAANPILYKTAADLTAETGEVTKKGEHPDHIVVIKHVPAVGDSSELTCPLASFVSADGQSERSTSIILSS